MNTAHTSQYGHACSFESESEDSSLRVEDRQAGFTLIELITAITIMSVLSTIGIASFVNYSRIQALSNAAHEITTTLQLAKASASSQVKPITCSGALRGYEVTVSAVQRTYTIFPLCDGPDTSSEKVGTLPTNVEIEAGGATSVLFKTVTGDVVVTPNNTVIELTHTEDGTMTKTITIDPKSGRIEVE